MLRTWSGMEGVDKTKKVYVQPYPALQQKKPFLTSQTQFGRGVQYPVMQTPTGIWINNKLIKPSIILTAHGHWAKSSRLILF